MKCHRNGLQTTMGMSVGHLVFEKRVQSFTTAMLGVLK